MKNSERNLMYNFVANERPNPLGGSCYGCIYCYIHGKKGMKNWLPKLKEKYHGEFKLYDKVLKRIREIKSIKPVFFCDTIDYLHEENSDKNILEIWSCIWWNRDTEFISLTKNPKRYNDLIELVPSNVILGVTIESDIDYPYISDAPKQFDRIQEFLNLNNLLEYYNKKNKLFISIEPILKFNLYRFANILKEIKPEFGIAIGYDNHLHKLPEPSLNETLELRKILRDYEINIIDKTYRNAWWEK